MTIFNRKLYIFIVFLMIGAFSATVAMADIVEPDDVNKYSNVLPVIRDLGLRYDLTGGGNITVEMKETKQNILGAKTGGGIFPDTTVWGYEFPGLPTTYPGATIVAYKDVPVDIKWKNKLPKGSHLVVVDTTLHMAEPIMEAIKKKYIPTVTHLHGGHTESASDGLPEAWFTQGYTLRGAVFQKKTYHYDNDQEGATLWYHDHALGVTRLNVYAGLAGFYLLRDDNEMNLINGGILPSGAQEIEIVFQDRFFMDDGSLLMPSRCSDPGAAGDLVAEFVECPAEDDAPGGANFPTAIAEFFGDIQVVNGKAWPRLNVDKGKYRLRVLNGSDSRFNILQFRTSQNDQSTANAIPFWVIGNDNGLLNTPVSASYANINNTLLIGPGERYDIVIDTTEYAGSFFFLRNIGPDEPFGGGVPEFGCDDDDCFEPANVNSTGQLMRFDVSNVDAPVVTVSEATELRPNDDQLMTPSPTPNPRQVALFEGMDEYGRLQPLLGTVAEFSRSIPASNGTLAWFQKITENPALNATETWEVFNSTGDAHPMHLHLVSFSNYQPGTVEN